MAKKGRRAKGEDSIYQRKSDGQWVARLRVSDPTGKFRPVYRYCKTEKAALAALRQLKRKYEDGADLTAPDPKVADYLAR